MRKATCAIAVLAALALLGSGTQAQAPEIGFRFGPSVATMSGMDASFEDESGAGRFSVRSNRRTGFAAGGFVRVPRGSLGLQTELMYVQKGTGVEVSATVPGLGASSARVELQLDYLEVPVLLRYDMPAATLFPFVYGGPALAVEVRCRSRGEIEGETRSEDCDAVDDGPDRESVDVGLMLGGGLGLPAGTGRLVLEARYSLGLRNLDRNPARDTDKRSRTLGLLLGYSIPMR